MLGRLRGGALLPFGEHRQEGHGLSRRWQATADRRAVIPMSAGIDSLNVAAATAVACYLTARR